MLGSLTFIPFTKMKCGVCESGQSKYKCPRCFLSYCSLYCWKEHRKIKCEPVPPPKTVEEEGTLKHSQEYKYQTEDTVPLDRLKLLESSTVMQQIFKNPHLQELLVSIDSSSNPEYAMQLAMQEPLFIEFADECLRVIEPTEDAPK